MDYLSIKKEGQDGSNTISNLNNYVCLLRAAYLIHQNGHWKCSGGNFYGNHLLFQRIYESVSDRTDAIAEKIIGIFGNDALRTKKHPSRMSEICDKFTDENPLVNSIEVEKMICLALENIYDEIKESGNMTMGLDDILMSQHGDAETSIFLLRQALGK
jgi:DNA-binding ferritin-like protein